MLHTLKAGILKDISVYLVLKKRIEKGKRLGIKEVLQHISVVRDRDIYIHTYILLEGSF